MAAFRIASQIRQELTLEANEYSPASQRVHNVAPGSVPVFVMEPAGQEIQFGSPSAPKYPTSQLATTALLFDVQLTAAALFIASQVRQFATAELSEYKPTSHRLHEVAPDDVPVSVIEPDEQTKHEVSPLIP